MRQAGVVAALALAGALLAGCGSSSAPAGGAGAGGGSGGGSGTAVLPQGAMCILKSPYLALGTTPDLTVDGVTYTHSHQPDAPSALELPLADPGPQPAGACRGNTQYRFGSGLYDTAGPIGGDPTGHADFFGEVLPPQVPNGIHTRPFARAFAFASPCNGKRVMFMSIDLMGMSALIRQEVLKAVAADPVLKQYYGPDNIMLSGTHTHEIGGGFGLTVLPDLSSTLPAALNDVYVYIQTLLISNPDYDDDNFHAITGGIVQAMRRAHANLEAHGTADIKLAIGQLLNANVNRDPPAYAQDPPSERAQYLDANGHEVNVDKRFLQLNLVRANGSAVGVLNWFGVHPTAMGNHDLLMSSDNKGYASLGFEKLMGTKYVPDPNGEPDGVADNFVAAFAQTDEGDAVPDLFVFDADVNGGNGPGQGVPYSQRGGTDDPYQFSEPGFTLGEPKFTAVSGTKQLAQALMQYTQGGALSGPVDYRFFYADLSADTITDPAVLAGLTYSDEPAGLYSPAKTTCTSGYGISQFAGGVNAPDFGAAGYACAADAPVPYFNQVRSGYNGLYNGTGYIAVEKNDTPLVVPFPGVALYDAATPLLCAATALQSQYACQDEKPVTVGASTNPVPIQIFRLGNLAVLGLPLEVTTMSARRLRKTVLDALSPAGVDTVVIAGLSNDYHEYMASREEYTAQMYEGASTIFGPWQLAAIQQESRRLALTLAAGQPAPQGVAAPVLPTGPASPVTVDPQSEFGQITRDARGDYTLGDTVDVAFVSGYPGNDLKTMRSYLYAERQNAQGGWDVVAQDRDPELTLVWHSSPSLVSTELSQAGPSTVEALWQIPRNAPPGVYRIRHEGVYRLSVAAAPQPYEGISSAFRINGTAGACP